MNKPTNVFENLNLNGKISMKKSLGEDKLYTSDIPQENASSYSVLLNQNERINRENQNHFSEEESFENINHFSEDEAEMNINFISQDNSVNNNEINNNENISLPAKLPEILEDCIFNIDMNDLELEENIPEDKLLNIFQKEVPKAEENKKKSILSFLPLNFINNNLEEEKKEYPFFEDNQTDNNKEINEETFNNNLLGRKRNIIHDNNNDNLNNNIICRNEDIFISSNPDFINEIKSFKFTTFFPKEREILLIMEEIKLKIRISLNKKYSREADVKNLIRNILDNDITIQKLIEQVDKDIFYLRERLRKCLEIAEKSLQKDNLIFYKQAHYNELSDKILNLKTLFENIITLETNFVNSISYGAKREMNSLKENFLPPRFGFKNIDKNILSNFDFDSSSENTFLINNDFKFFETNSDLTKFTPSQAESRFHQAVLAKNNITKYNENLQKRLPPAIENKILRIIITKILRLGKDWQNRECPCFYLLNDSVNGSKNPNLILKMFKKDDFKKVFSRYCTYIPVGNFIGIYIRNLVRGGFEFIRDFNIENANIILDKELLTQLPYDENPDSNFTHCPEFTRMPGFSQINSVWQNHPPSFTGKMNKNFNPEFNYIIFDNNNNNLQSQYGNFPKSEEKKLKFIKINCCCSLVLNIGFIKNVSKLISTNKIDFAYCLSCSKFCCAKCKKWGESRNYERQPFQNYYNNDIDIKYKGSNFCPYCKQNSLTDDSEFILNIIENCVLFPDFAEKTNTIGKNYNDLTPEERHHLLLYLACSLELSE